jgi:hypothetical protein
LAKNKKCAVQKTIKKELFSKNQKNIAKGLEIIEKIV